MEKMDANIVNYSSPEEITIVDIANYFLLKEKMSQNKIQKMCYYAYAWYHALSENDDVLVENCVFEAWAHGPVNKDLRTLFKDFGWRDLVITEESRETTKNYLEEKLGTDITEFLEDVWNAYGHLTADELERLTHIEDPWVEKRVGLGRFDKSTRKISNKTMKNFYRHKAV